MWKNISESTPRGSVNILVTDGKGGFCIVKTLRDGELPIHRYMMKTKDDYYYISRGAVSGWLYMHDLRLLLEPDKVDKIL